MEIEAGFDRLRHSLEQRDKEAVGVKCAGQEAQAAFGRE